MDKWKTVLAVGMLIGAVIFEWNWFWGFIVGMTLWHMLSAEEIHFVETVTKKEHPKLYWSLLVIWTTIGVYTIAQHLSILT
jgi:hypothetical protein